VFEKLSNQFVIQRIIYNRNSGLALTVNGLIHNGLEKNFIRLIINARDPGLLLFIIFWYSISCLVFLAAVYAMIQQHAFSTGIFIPVFFVLFGYLVSTANSSMKKNKLNAAIRKATE